MFVTKIIYDSLWNLFDTLWNKWQFCEIHICQQTADKGNL